MSRISRYTTGSRIENHFLDLLELIYKAYYIKLDTKSEIIIQATSKNDTIKFLLQIAFENKFIKEKEYLNISAKLQEVGKMLNGWRANIESKNIKQNTP